MGLGGRKLAGTPMVPKRAVARANRVALPDRGFQTPLLRGKATELEGALALGIRGPRYTTRGWGQHSG